MAEDTDVFIEEWTSSQNQHERHFFIGPGSGSGEQYLFGINPFLFNEDEIEFMKLTLLGLLKLKGAP